LSTFSKGIPSTTPYDPSFGVLLPEKYSFAVTFIVSDLIIGCVPI